MNGKNGNNGPAPAGEQKTGGAKVPALPAWKVILHMVRFQPWYWFIDFWSVFVFRMAWQVAPGLLTQAFFDKVTGDAPVSLSIWAIIALVFTALLARVLGSLGFIYADVPLFNNVAFLLRRNLLHHILRRPGAAPLPDSPGEAVSRFRNDVMEVPLFVIWSNDILVGLLIIVVSLSLLVRVSLPITLVALAPLALVGLIANAASKRIEQYRRASRQATGEVTGFIGEFFGAVQAVKVATAEKNVIGHFNRLNDERRRLTLRERVFDRVLVALYDHTSSLLIGSVLIVAGQSMREGTFTIGDFSLFVYLLQGLSNLTTLSGELMARYKQLNVSVERMYRLMEGAPLNALVETVPVNLQGPPPEIARPEHDPDDALQTLEARGLSYRYPGSENGVSGLNLRLKRGTLTVITGRVGSGKTTFLRVLLGLLPRDAGEIRWNGRVIEDPGSFFVPPRCAYTGQAPRLFSDTLRNNILLGQEKPESEILEAIRLAVMERDLPELEKGLDTLVGPRGVRLSGGQAQRTAAARMLVRGPELLVFDDLSSALDVETERLLWERLFEQRDGSSTAAGSPSAATCLVVSHRRPVLRRADHIILMKEGRIEEEGSLDELLERSEEMRQLWMREAVN